MKNTLKYGIVGGLIMVSSWFISLTFFDGAGEDMKLSEILGFATMFLALIVVFIGVKNKRDKELEGLISFGNAFKFGLNIVLVASAIYVIGWMIYYPNFMPDFMDQYAASQMRSYQEAGLSASEIAEKQKEMENWTELYKNPFIMAGMTFMEFFPIGLVGAVLSAFVLKKKK